LLSRSTATSVDNRYALFVGGQTFLDPGKYSNVIDIFDSLSGMWNTTALSRARCSLATTSLGNLAFFGGGQTNEIQLSNVVDIFNSATQTWNNTTLSQARYYLAASLGNLALIWICNESQEFKFAMWLVFY
jgi:hypothetical protein